MLNQNYQFLSRELHSEVTQICQPLKRLNISYFAHVRVDQEGNFAAFNSNPCFIEHYINNKYYNADIHQAKRKFDSFVIWDLIERRGKSEKMHSEAAEFGVRHTFTIIEKEKNYKNYFHFATHRFNPAINQVYLENFDLLKLFVLYAKQAINESKILSSIYDEKIKIDQNSEYEINPKANLIAPETREIFLKELNINTINAKIDTNTLQIPGISTRETDVLILLVNGFTAKYIADQLKISRRTVEHHIENMKSKLGVKNTIGLIKLAFKSGYIV